MVLVKMKYYLSSAMAFTTASAIEAWGASPDIVLSYFTFDVDADA